MHKRQCCGLGLFWIKCTRSYNSSTKECWWPLFNFSQEKGKDVSSTTSCLTNHPSGQRFMAAVIRFWSNCQVTPDGMVLVLQNREQIGKTGFIQAKWKRQGICCGPAVVTPQTGGREQRVRKHRLSPPPSGEQELKVNFSCGRLQPSA